MKKVKLLIILGASLTSFSQAYTFDKFYIANAAECASFSNKLETNSVEDSSPSTCEVVENKQPLSSDGVRNNYSTHLIDSSKWMATVRDDRSIASLTIPGTHDSATWKYSNQFAEDFVRTQNANFTEQLNQGIRYFDIRVRPAVGDDKKGGWILHHGDSYLRLIFDDFLRDADSWLKTHPTETLLVSIKQDKEPEGNPPSNNNIFKHYQEKYPDIKWYTEQIRIPTLGEVRGKIVLLNRYSGNQGLDLSGWDDNNPPDAWLTNIFGYVQDVYKAGGKDKINAILTFMDRHHESDSLTFNFTSASTGSCLYQPIYCKRNIMPGLYKALNQTKADGSPVHDLRHTIYPMDFYDTDFVAKLIANN